MIEETGQVQQKDKRLFQQPSHSAAIKARAQCNRTMKARSLFLVVGTVLPGLAQELLSSDGGPDHLHKIIYMEQVAEGDGQYRQHTSNAQQQQQQHPRPRRLQIRLKDDLGEEPGARSDMAYAALLMNDHDRGIRTLGQSLIDTRTTADLVAVLGTGVSKATEDRMRAQGWRIRRLEVDDAGVGSGGDSAFDMDSASGSVSSELIADVVGKYCLSWPFVTNNF